MAVTTPDAVPGELITAAWGDAVRADLTALDTGKLAKAGDTATGTMYVGVNATTANGTGIHLRNDGLLVARSNDPTSLSEASLNCSRAGTGAAVGGKYVTFNRAASTGGTPTEAGSIAVTTGGATAFNTSSDYRLKDVVGPVDDPLGRLAALIVRRLAWKATGDQFDGFLAHEVADVVPDAVTGDYDAVGDDGSIEPQQLDTSRLVPLLVAAVQTLTARVAALEARA